MYVHRCVTMHVFVCLCLYVYLYVCICVLIYACLLVSRCEYVWMCVFCVCVYLSLIILLLVSIYVSQHKCLLKVNQISVCIFYLGCYLSVWHCYLGSILAFKIEIQISYNLWTKPLNQLRLIYEQFIYVLYLDLDVYIYFVMNKFWLIDWLIDLTQQASNCWHQRYRHIKASTFCSTITCTIIIDLGKWLFFHILY